jgi:3-oxoacyl-[acyl-carrier protein] reductase
MTTTPMPRWPGIDGQIALVTGASRGIGQAIAAELAAHGARVIGTATTSEGAAGITESLATAAIPGAGWVLDVRDAQAIDTAIAEITASHGSPTILVNNAGITRDNLLLRMKEEEWGEVLTTNLSSVYRLSKGCLRGMTKARRGRIVNIASVVALIGNPGQTNYAAAKAGMIGFTKSLAREVATRNITVNAVAPGFIESDMTRALSEAQIEALRGQIPSGRLGTPLDVAAAVAYLCSDGAAYITGETLNVNGGLSMQ